MGAFIIEVKLLGHEGMSKVFWFWRVIMTLFLNPLETCPSPEIPFLIYRSFIKLEICLLTVKDDSFNNLHARVVVVNTSTKLWEIKRPFLAADEPTTIAFIWPSLYWKPMCPVESLWSVSVLSNGLKNKRNRILRHSKLKGGSFFRLLKVKIIFTCLWLQHRCYSRWLS